MIGILLIVALAVAGIPTAYLIGVEVGKAQGSSPQTRGEGEAHRSS